MDDVIDEKELWKRFLQVVPSLKTLNQWAKEAKIQVEGFRPGQVAVKEKLVASIMKSSMNFNKMKKFLKKLVAKHFATEEARMLVQGYSEETLLSLATKHDNEEEITLIMAELLVEEMAKRKKMIAQMLNILETARKRSPSEPLASKAIAEACLSDDVEQIMTEDSKHQCQRVLNQKNAMISKLKADMRAEMNELKKEKQKVDNRCNSYQEQMLKQKEKIEELEQDKHKLQHENNAIKLKLENYRIKLAEHSKEKRLVLGTEMKEYRKVLDEQKKYEVRFINVLTDQQYTNEAFLAQQPEVLVLEATLPLRNLQKLRAIKADNMSYIKTVEALKRALR